MLRRLVIRNVVLIETLELDFGPGLTVLTGETGAGKSILLDALGLALGQRSDPSLIRQGCDQASIVAEFSITEPWLPLLLAEHGLENAETLMLRRVLPRQGASRAYVNDQAVSVGLLKLIGEQLLEVHGQFDRLLTPASHRHVLDSFGQIDTMPIIKAYHYWQTQEKAYAEAAIQRAHFQQNREFLVAQVAELSVLKPVVGEEENLMTERQRLAQGQRLEEALSQGEDGVQSALPPLYAAEKSLQRMKDLLGDLGAQALGAVARAVIETKEAAALIGQMQRDYHYNPARLAEIDDRLQELRMAARKYGCKPDELLTLWQAAEGQLDPLLSEADRLKQHDEERQQAYTAYQTAAQVLHEQRGQAAQRLIPQINQELPALKLDQARFDVDIALSGVENEHGIDTVEFRVSTNPGQSPAALSKVASGGELSRLMLALKVALAEPLQLGTLVFDEIDQGVGGAVAAAIGERLARLAQHLQVLVITHSPQIAAFANYHLVVKKSLSDTQMLTEVTALTEEFRREELARMLSGEEITAEARAAAVRLLRNN